MAQTQQKCISYVKVEHGKELTLLQVVIWSLWLMEILPNWTGFQSFPKCHLHSTHPEGKQQRGMDSGVFFFLLLLLLLFLVLALK